MTNEQLLCWIEGLLYNNFDIAAVTIKNKIKEVREASIPMPNTTVEPPFMVKLPPPPRPGMAYRSGDTWDV